jgi:hypothetical protein
MLLYLVDIYYCIFVGMRIKKKHVLKESLLLEGLLIDDLNMDPFDKKALKALHKRYKDSTTWDISSLELVDELHEQWMIPLEKAFKIVHTYLYKRDYLFSEHDYIPSIKTKQIYSRYARKFFKKFRDNLDNEHLTPEGEFWELKIGDEVLPFEANFWDQWDGFNFYLPVDWDLRWGSRGSDNERDWDQYILLVDVKFDWEKDTFDVTYRIGKDDNEQRGVIVNDHSFEYPEGEVTYENAVSWVGDMVNIVKPLVQQFNFPSVEDDGTGM